MNCLKKILLIRHGQTEWNVHGRFQGKTDTMLSPKGVGQAQYLAERLKDVRIDRIYCSPLKRALDTAKPIALRKGLETVEREELKEVDFGPWEGLTLEQIKARFPEEYDKCRKNPYRYGFRFGLPFEGVMQAVKRFTDDCIHNDEVIAVVSHSVPLKMLLLHLTGLPPEFIHSFRLDNCSVSVVGMDETESDNKYTILSLNNT